MQQFEGMRSNCFYTKYTILLPILIVIFTVYLVKQVVLICSIFWVLLPVSAQTEVITPSLIYSPMNFLQNLFAPKDKRTLAEIVGPLKANPDYAGWYESEPVQIPYLDQKLKITFTKGNDSVFMAAAEGILKRFLQLNTMDQRKDSKKVELYYQACIKELGVTPLSIKEAKDVWDFVTPTNIIVEQNINGKFYVTLSCKCEWEKTHGLQLVFREGKKLTRASGHDGQFEDWN